jgi:hypothetical protein
MFFSPENVKKRRTEFKCHFTPQTMNKKFDLSTLSQHFLKQQNALH